MRTIRNVAMGVLLTVFLASGRGMAQEVTVGREADHTALRALMSNIVVAINSQDVGALSKCFAKDFVFTAVDQTVLTNAASIKAYYAQMLSDKDSPVSAFEMAPKADVLTRFTDANTGYCFGSSDDTYTVRRNKRVVHITSRWTAVVIREDGEWKAAAVHTGVNFLDNPVLEAKTLSTWGKISTWLGLRKYPGEK